VRSSAWSECGMGSGGLGDGEAEGLDLPDVVTELAVGVEAGLVVAGPRSVNRTVRSVCRRQMMTRMERATVTWALALPRRRRIQCPWRCAVSVPGTLL
jgi:hypothetical protein